MTDFVYLIAEGVTDVVFLQRVLRQYFDMVQVTQKSELDEQAMNWLDSFKWPYGDNIARHAVPAPVFMKRDGLLVILRNAQGIQRLNSTFELDDAAFEHLDWKPSALGVFVDADDQAPSERFADYRASLKPGDSFPELASLESAEAVHSENGRRAGVFVFPGSNETGTVDSLLLAIGKEAFFGLYDVSESFVTSWSAEHKKEPLYKDLGKPAGTRKAQLSAMAAILKPGKNLSASLQDHPWLPLKEPTERLKPLVIFLRKLVGEPPA